MKHLDVQDVYNKLHHLEKQLAISTVKYLTAEEAANFLGFSITYLYELTSKRAIPFYKPSGKKLLFKHSDLFNWIEGSRFESTSEIKNKLKERNK